MLPKDSLLLVPAHECNRLSRDIAEAVDGAQGIVSTDEKRDLIEAVVMCCQPRFNPLLERGMPDPSETADVT